MKDLKSIAIIITIALMFAVVALLNYLAYDAITKEYTALSIIFGIVAIIIDIAILLGLRK